MEYLKHHGVLGQKWGVRRYQNYDGSLTPAGVVRYGVRNTKKARVANLDKWGKTPDTNTLYIAGYSGSGKSTTALSVMKKGDTLINLDFYSEPFGKGAVRDKRFTDYLSKKRVDYNSIAEATSSNNKSKFTKFSKEYWKEVDKFRNAIDDYSKEEYKKGNRVIVEGVQIADDWLSSNKDYYKGKPMIILNTNAYTSMKRAFKRDDRGGLIKGLSNLDSAKEYFNWYSATNKKLDELASETDTIKRGKTYIMENLYTTKEAK